MALRNLNSLSRSLFSSKSNRVIPTQYSGNNYVVAEHITSGGTTPLTKETLLFKLIKMSTTDPISTLRISSMI